MIETILKIMICPAVIFAKRRIIKAKGLVKIPISSIGARIGSTHHGTPLGVKMCPQKFLFPFNSMSSSVNRAKENVKAMFPDKFALKGKKGMSPIKLFIKIKKKSVSI